MIGRFRPIGRLTLSDWVVDHAEITFAARHSGEGLRPLPPFVTTQRTGGRTGRADLFDRLLQQAERGHAS